MNGVFFYYNVIMKKVLIVDDAPGWVRFHKNNIEYLKADVTIDTACSALEGLSKIEVHQDEPYDVILTDLQMESNFLPKPAGEWFIEQIQMFSEYKNSKIVIISASDNIENIAKKHNVDFVSKYTIRNSDSNVYKNFIDDKNDGFITFEKVENIKELAQLASEIWNEYWTKILTQSQIDYMIEKFQSERAIKEQITDENYIYFYILCEGKIVGYIGLSQRPEYLFLSNLYLKNGYRDKGIGTKAFKFIKDYADSNNYNRIVLTVNKYNENSIKAYRKWGFTIIDSVVTDIGQGFVMDDYIMEYQIIP